MIQVFSKNNRDLCLPYTEDVVKDVSTALPMIAVKRNEELFTIINLLKYYSTGTCINAGLISLIEDWLFYGRLVFLWKIGF